MFNQFFEPNYKILCLVVIVSIYCALIYNTVAYILFYAVYKVLYFCENPINIFV